MISRLTIRQNGPLLVAGLLLLIAAAYIFAAIPPYTATTTDEQRTIIYPLLILSNMTGLIAWGVSLVALVLLGFYAARKNVSQMLFIVLTIFGLGVALLVNWSLNLLTPLIMVLPIGLVFIALSTYYRSSDTRKSFISAARVVAVVLLANVFLCHASILLPFSSLEHKESIPYEGHLYNLAIMETDNTVTIDKQAIVFQCDSAGLLCHRTYISPSSAGCPVQNQTVSQDTQLVVEEGNKLYLEMGDQKILIA